MYFSNSQASRDLPIPAIPLTEVRCATPLSAESCSRSLMRVSSRERPTKGERRARFSVACAWVVCWASWAFLCVLGDRLGHPQYALILLPRSSGLDEDFTT